MGRTILVEENIQKQLEEYLHSSELTVGLIIGKSWSQKDFAVHLARTPSPDEPAKSCGDGAAQKHKAKKQENVITAADDHWIANHAKQVLRMLPGGLEVMGVFSIGPPHTMQNAQAKLRGIVYAVQKTVNKTFPGQTSILPPGTPVYRVALQICSATRKVTCRTYNVTDTKCSAEPAEWKYQSFVDRWLQLSSSLSVDLIMPVYHEQLSSELHKQIQSSLQPMYDNVHNSICTIDGKLIGGSQSIVPAEAQQAGGKKKKGRTIESSHHPTNYDLQLYTVMTSNNKSTEKTTSATGCCAKLWFRGTMTCRAFVHPKASMDDASGAIKEDAIRTLSSRCDLLCEDLLQTEEDQDPKVLYETPVRVYGKVDNSPLYFCDYMFPDEAASDSIDRFKELMDLPLAETDMELDKEAFPEDKDIEKPDRHATAGKGETKVQPESVSLANIAGLVVSGAMAALAAGLSYLYLGQDSQGQ